MKQDFTPVNENAFPLWKRGIEGDFSTVRSKAPLAPPLSKGGNFMPQVNEILIEDMSKLRLVSFLSRPVLMQA
jgi:hypothetical protein